MVAGLLSIVWARSSNGTCHDGEVQQFRRRSEGAIDTVYRPRDALAHPTHARLSRCDGRRAARQASFRPESRAMQSPKRARSRREDPRVPMVWCALTCAFGLFDLGCNRYLLCLIELCLRRFVPGQRLVDHSLNGCGIDVHRLRGEGGKRAERLRHELGGFHKLRDGIHCAVPADWKMQQKECQKPWFRERLGRRLQALRRSCFAAPLMANS